MYRSCDLETLVNFRSQINGEAWINGEVGATVVKNTLKSVGRMETFLENNKQVYPFIRDLRVTEANLFTYKKIKIIPNNK